MQIIAGVLLALQLVSYILSKKQKTLDKLSPYECGLEPIGDARLEFKIVYYIIGILYLQFDLEIIFLYPQATSLLILKTYIGFISILLFFILLTIAFIYEWYQGALNLKVNDLPLEKSNVA